MKPTVINIEVIINRGIADVWNYYTNPQHIVGWNFAIDDWHCPNATNDLNVGGKYFARMEAKDGSFGFDLIGIYNEIIPNQKLSYILEDQRKVVTTFKDLFGKTQVNTAFEAESTNPKDKQKAGWQSILNNFKKYVENNPNQHQQKRHLLV